MRIKSAAAGNPGPVLPEKHMPPFPSLRQRQPQPEVMDQPGLDRARHFHALRGLERLNRVSGSAGLLWPALRRLAGKLGPRPPRVLDVATGAGDVPISLWLRARRHGLDLQVDGCDVSSLAIDYARQRAAWRAADVGFFHLNALTAELPLGYDVLTASLFLHHLDDGQAESLLGRMARVAESLVLVNDLRRGVTGYLLAWTATRLLSSSDIVHTDGPLSVAAAFTMNEVRSIAARAGLNGVTIARRWPCRFLLTWWRP